MAHALALLCRSPVAACVFMTTSDFAATRKRDCFPASGCVPPKEPLVEIYSAPALLHTMRRFAVAFNG